MQSLKACALLPALADIAAWRSHSVASWLTVLGAFMVSLAGGVLAVLPDGREVCGVAHAAKRRSAAKNSNFMVILVCSLSLRKSPLILFLSKESFR
jgi:hypothetical protein